MSGRGRRFWLLPPDSPHGWTPYAWLFYLVSFMIEPAFRINAGRAGPLYLGVTALGLAVFLWTYFRAYRVRGLKLVPLVAIQTLLGIGFATINIGSSVFFVYAAATAAQLDRVRDAGRAVILIALLGGATAYVTQPPFFFWIVAIGITLLVGGVNLHYAQQSRAHHKLRMAQEEVERMAAVAERERIARDMHDVLGHTLSLIVLKAELASRLAERDTQRAAAEMRDVEDVARRALTEVRAAIRGYHATLPDEVSRARAMLKAAGIRAEIEVHEAALPQGVEETLALALREAVTNVVRHSGASRCTIRLADGNDYTLEIADDGRGFDGVEGGGLRGMRERAESLGGRIERDVGDGMRIRVILPHQPHRAVTQSRPVPARPA